MSNRLFSLLEQHQKLDEALRLAERRKRHDWHELVRLKKLKLAVKDRIARLLHRKGAITLH